MINTLYYFMGVVLDVLLGKQDSLDDANMKQLDYSTTDMQESTEFVIRTATINTKSDMLKVEEALRSGVITIVEIGPLRGEITQDTVLDFLKETASNVDGDIVYRSETELIVTPRGARVSRESIC